MQQNVDEVDSRPRWSPESHYARNTSIWDKPRSQGGKRPDSHEEFPKMLYKARRKTEGGPYMWNDPTDERFSASCQLTVEDETKFKRALADGWRETPDEAMRYVREAGDAKALAAAHRHHEDKRLSAKAQAEAAEADASTAEHLPEIPVKRRGRKPRSAAPSA